MPHPLDHREDAMTTTPDAQPYYASGPPPRDPATAQNWQGTTALVLGLVGIFTWVTAIPAVVFGHLSLAAARRGEADNRGTGLAGLITGYVVLILGLLVGIAIGAALVLGAGFVVDACGGDSPAQWCTDGGAS